MKYIVRIVTEEAFRGLTTGYVGPFDTSGEAEALADRTEAESGYEAEAYIEELHEPKEN